MYYLHIFHYFGFFGAQICNAILAILIVKRAGKLFGDYRNVMFVFTLCSMWYSWVEILTQPVLHMKGPMCIVFIDHGEFPTEFGNYVVCLHCATFGFIISLLSVQFFYRWCVLCRPGVLKFFKGHRLSLMFIPSIVIYIFWFFVVALGYPASPEKREYMREDLLTLFNADAMIVPLVAPFYWEIGVDGERIWRFKDLIAAGICCIIIGTLCNMILFFAFNIYWYMKTARAQLSKKTLELNRQLFIMLTVQTLFPFITMYIPVGLLISLPLFNLGMGPYTNYTSASIAIYPLIEPLVAMCCIADFRKTILGVFGWEKEQAVSSSNQIEMHTVEPAGGRKRIGNTLGSVAQ